MCRAYIIGSEKSSVVIPRGSWPSKVESGDRYSACRRRAYILSPLVHSIPSEDKHRPTHDAAQCVHESRDQRSFDHKLLLDTSPY
jgi:hypothetical protein